MDERRRRLPENRYPILSVSVFAGLAAAISSGVVSQPSDRYSTLCWPAIWTICASSAPVFAVVVVNVMGGTKALMPEENYRKVRKRGMLGTTAGH